MVEACSVALAALDELCGVAGEPFFEIEIWLWCHLRQYPFLAFVAGFSRLRVPAAQDDRPCVPRVIVQIPVFIRPHDVVNAERPRAPPQRRLVRLSAVRVEQPPAAHVHLPFVADMMRWYGVSLARAMSQSAMAGRGSTLAMIRQERLII